MTDNVDWEKRIAEAKTPEEVAKLFQDIFSAADAELRKKGLSDAEREALLEELLQRNKV